MILDTSFLLDLKDGDEAAFGKAVELYDADEPQRVSAISALELTYGASYVDSAEERRRVRNLLLMYPSVDVDDETAGMAGELLARADRDAGGESGVDTEDGIIGALARRLGEPVVTATVGDFERIDVPVELY